MALKKELYSDIVVELQENFSDIYKNYHRVFIPLLDPYNETVIQAFASKREEGYERNNLDRNFREVLVSACNQNVNIAGIYIKCFADDSNYIYYDQEQHLEYVSKEIMEHVVTEESRRGVIGGRIVQMINRDTELPYVFGIQSGILNSGTEYSYQITVLYDLSVFDQILSKYGTNEDMRFFITLVDGMVIYDSWKQYDVNQNTYFEKMDELWRNEVRIFSNNRFMSFYMEPQEVTEKIQLDDVSKMILLMAIVMCGIVISFLLFIYRIIRQKIEYLEMGMMQVVESDMSLRIPIENVDNEFTRIAEKINQMCDMLKVMIDKNYVAQMLQRNAEYKALQTSVNPHFLYNSLEAIRERFVVNGREDEAEMVLLLARIFEYQIRGDSIVTIRKELNSTQNYIDFCSIRYQYAFEYSVDFQENILNYAVPKQIFQPIIENYFVHGYQEGVDGYLSIEGYLGTEDGMIHICFRDNGKGLTKTEVEELNKSLQEELTDTTHIGLQNVNKRLQIVYGELSYMKVISNEPSPGISVCLVFKPLNSK